MNGLKGERGLEIEAHEPVEPRTIWCNRHVVVEEVLVRQLLKEA